MCAIVFYPAIFPEASLARMKQGNALSINKRSHYHRGERKFSCTYTIRPRVLCLRLQEFVYNSKNALFVEGGKAGGLGPFADS
jgi:hypothetical protein